MKKNLTLQILEELRPKYNYQLELIDPTGWLAKIRFPNGCVLPFSANILPINDYLPALHATDKWFGYQLLRHDGLSIPETKVFFRNDYAEYAAEGQTEKNGYGYLRGVQRKIVIKPNRLHSGKGVTITDVPDQAAAGFKKALSLDHLVLVQEYIPWDEYRLLYLDDDLLWAYKKIPGPESGEVLNLSQGAFLREEPVGERFLDIGREAMAAVGLRYGAVDIKIEENPDPCSAYAIIELNSNPVYRWAWDQGYQKKIMEIHEKLIESLLAECRGGHW
jgi:glutathione synthase/RimK-type ligase-like ATP-grasp enzyme